jgi:hypothetical protein
MNARRYRILSGVARILGWLLVVTPVAVPLIGTWYTFAFPSQQLLDYMAESGGRPPWDAKYLLVQYISTPALVLPSLAILGAGLWLLLAKLSWKNGITAIVVTVPLVLVGMYALGILDGYTTLFLLRPIFLLLGPFM